MKLKLEASGWPSHVKTEEEKDAYIEGHLRKDGGKLGERTMRTSTTFVNSYGALIKMLEDKTIQVKSIIPLGEELLQVSHEPVEEMDESFATTSLVHAAFTTCHGRMLLYSYLDIVGTRAAYHDTDSICFLSEPGKPDPPLGEFLGDLTDQLADDYVGGNTSRLQSVVKVRGISINSSCYDTVTFEKLKKMVKRSGMKTTVRIPSQITRTSGWRIVSRPASKTWQVVISKRRRLGDKTVPYGFTDQLLSEDDEDCLDALEQLMDM
ncbi:Storkhead-box protein 2 [Frankliniella fusca]|uniref:Storkhead-box protein 2 n=1 Tax=Frankliniella fusca TaxID=407009 RepID=A0AAE1HGP5_9NEOP|nr:Storkhead-box protein 2 [Frankliniella fusca]